MTQLNTIDENLIAPCGMNCAVCSKYLAYANRLKRSQCPGCRARNTDCTYLFGKWEGMNHVVEGTAEAKFCFECDRYPCKEIKRMDKRYRKNYGMSTVENLDAIQQNGLAEFVEAQYSKHQCDRCDGLISVHNNKCFRCDKVTQLVEK